MGEKNILLKSEMILFAIDSKNIIINPEKVIFWIFLLKMSIISQNANISAGNIVFRIKRPVWMQKKLNHLPIFSIEYYGANRQNVEPRMFH
jgi:hypothetical protein